MKTPLSYIGLIISLVFLICPGSALAQEDYQWEVGGGIQTTGYLGDASGYNQFSNPGFAVEALLRYLPSPRIALKTGLYAGKVNINNSGVDNVLPGNPLFSKSSTFGTLEEVLEFNFLNFGVGERYRKLKPFTPYYALGLGISFWNAGDGVRGALSLPMGLGLKYKLSERMNIGLEYNIRKVFSDKFDGDNLKDPYGITSSPLKNTDWFSTLGITLSYEFSKRCIPCYYKK